MSLKSIRSHLDVACAAFRPLKQHSGEKSDISVSNPSVAAAVIRQSELGQQRPGCNGPVCPLNSTDVCALKRVWVEEEHQGASLGKVLITAAVALAKQRGYRRMVLDTLKQLESANKVYEQLGFKQRSPFYHNPLPGGMSNISYIFHVMNICILSCSTRRQPSFALYLTVNQAWAHMVHCKSL